MRPLALFSLGACLTARASPQSVPGYVARGDSLAAALEPQAALVQYQHALSLDSTSYPALWKAADAAVDVAKQITTPSQRARRDSLYLVARRYAVAAVRADSLDANGHFELAQALGRYARTRGGRERVRYGQVIYDEAARALALDSGHAGAHHVIGAWHAEVKRLSPLTRFLAKTLFGAAFLSRASWDSATAHLQQAVRLRPDFIYHRLELAQVYLDLHRQDAARAELEHIATLPALDVMDRVYRREAAELLRTLAGR